MAVTASEITKGIDILREFGAERVVLFGSAVESPETAADLDLAVEGIRKEKYLEALGELEDALPIPVDLVDLSGDTQLCRRILRTGRVIYDRR